MKVEVKVLIYNMINNFIITLLKISGGFIFSLSSLFADGLHTLSDFLTDVLTLVGVKLTKKKATKHHPFGFGKLEYVTNIFVGFILFVLGIYIIVNAFSSDGVIPPLSVLILLIIVFILKLMAVIIMRVLGKKVNNQLLIVSYKESLADLYSTMAVAIISVLLQFKNRWAFLEYSDLIGSILIALIVFKTALKIIIDNSLAVIGETDNNEQIKEKVGSYLNNFKEIKNYKMTLIKYGTYYHLQLVLQLDPNLRLKEIVKLEKKVKKTIISHRLLTVKYVDIYVID